MKNIITLIAMTFVITACGGGGGSSSPATSFDNTTPVTPATPTKPSTKPSSKNPPQTGCKEEDLYLVRGECVTWTETDFYKLALDPRSYHNESDYRKEQYEQTEFPMDVTPYGYWEELYGKTETRWNTGDLFHWDADGEYDRETVMMFDDCFRDESCHGAQIDDGFFAVAENYELYRYEGGPAYQWSPTAAGISSGSQLTNAYHASTLDNIGNDFIFSSSIGSYQVSLNGDPAARGYEVEYTNTGIPVLVETRMNLEWLADNDNILVVQGFNNDTQFNQETLGTNDYHNEVGDMLVEAFINGTAADQIIIGAPIYPTEGSGTIGCPACAGRPLVNGMAQAGSAVDPLSVYAEHTLFAEGTNSCSSATPVVAAYAAKVKLANPGISAAELKELMFTTYSKDVQVVWSVTGEVITVRAVDADKIDAL